MAENEGHDQADNTEQHKPPLPLNVVIKDEAGEQAKEADTAHKEPDAQVSKPLPSPTFFQRFMHKHFPDAKAHDRWTLVFTAVIACSTFFYTIFAGWTLVEIRASSSDTHNLADAASKQANHTEAIAGAANKISGAADKFSASADAINQQTKDAVGKFDRMAKASEKSLGASQQSAQKSLDASIGAAQLDERAWLGLSNMQLTDFTPTEIKMKVDVANSGKTPALSVLEGHTVNSARTKIEQAEPQMLVFGVTSGPTVPPQGKYELRITVDPSYAEPILDDYEAIKDGKRFLYVIGELRYKDIYGRDGLTEFCLLLDNPATKQLIFCQFHTMMK